MDPLLLVDSHDGARGALATLLRHVGYSVREARNGIEGLLVARTEPPRLVIADLWPFFSASLQMVERLRAQGATTPVLVLTSAVSPEYRSRALAAGCDAYLEKPCDPQRVLAEVRRILDADPAPTQPP